MIEQFVHLPQRDFVPSPMARRGSALRIPLEMIQFAREENQGVLFGLGHPFS